MTSIAADAFKAVDSLNADFKACTLHSKTSLEITLKNVVHEPLKYLHNQLFLEH